MKDNRFFLVNVFRESKWLFSVFVLFIVGQLFFTLKGVETFPFLNWGMYSTKPEGTARVYTIELDEQKVKLSDLVDCRRQLVEGSLAKYEELISNNFYEKEKSVIEKRALNFPLFIDKKTFENALLNDSAVINKYPYWLIGTLADMRMVKTPVIKVTSNAKTIIDYNYEME
jgi:hypothetical protein